MNAIREAAQFAKQLRKSWLRKGFTLEPLTLLRLEWRGDLVQCDWFMRPIDFCDRKLPEEQALERQTEQAFLDALGVRELIFASFPAVMQAQLRMFRVDRHPKLELMMIGHVKRFDHLLHSCISAAIRAKQSGFEFVLTNGVLTGPIGDPDWRWNETLGWEDVSRHRSRGDESTNLTCNSAGAQFVACRREP